MPGLRRDVGGFGGFVGFVFPTPYELSEMIIHVCVHDTYSDAGLGNPQHPLNPPDNDAPACVRLNTRQRASMSRLEKSSLIAGERSAA